MVELTKEITLKDGIEKTLAKANRLQNSVLFSYSFRFEVRDLLPILTHPADKNTMRVYWEQPSRGFSFAGLGSIIEYQDLEKVHSRGIYQQIKQIMDEAVFKKDQQGWINHLVLTKKI